MLYEKYNYHYELENYIVGIKNISANQAKTLYRYLKTQFKIR